MWLLLQNLDIRELEPSGLSAGEEYVQRWVLALLLGSTELTSLSMVADCVPWTPVLGVLQLQHLELTLRDDKPWLEDLMADLSLCPCLETLKIADEGFWYDTPSKDLPDLLLCEVATLKSVELLGWYPKGDFTLPEGCLLRWLVVLDTIEWEEWQQKECPASMLLLMCMDLQEWPTGIQETSGLQFLDLYCTDLEDQDLAALQHISHVKLAFQEFSTFLLTGGSWQSLQISGEAGFTVNFFTPDAFVRGTERFLFKSPSEQAGDLFDVLRAACMRQGVACHEFEHAPGYPDGIKYARLSNVKLCRGPDNRDSLLELDEYWPSRANFPELYS